MQRVIVFSHLVAIATYLGATVFLAILVESVGTRALDASRRRQRYASLFRVYNPLTIGALGVVVMTGAWSLTPQKEALGERYFSLVGSLLVGKLSLAFLLIFVATWISFGICHRVVRADQGALPVTDADLGRMCIRLRVALWLAIALVLATMWVSLGPHTAIGAP